MSLRNDEELHSFPRRGLSSSSTSSLKRRLVRLARKSSDGSLRSSSSTGSSSTGRSAEAAAFRQPCKSRIQHHTNRLSGVFLRGAASGSLSVAMSTQIGKGSVSVADAEIVDDPSELSNQLSAPGILKIFGSEICKGAHYKSVLATTHSSAKELVKEALERYGFGKDEASSYVLCDTIGSIGERLWKTEGFRVVGDNEKPLLLQSLWKPREGLARRFEIQRRSLVEEQSSKEQDTITAGINAQARKLQKSRSRVNSTLVERAMSQSQKLWRSKSEMDLIEADSATKANEDESTSLNGTLVESHKCPEAGAELNDIDHAVHSKGDGGSQAKTETLCPSRPRGEQEGEESEREETESSDDNTTQYSIHPPQDCPYLLLLHGRSLVQDFVIYLLMSPNIVVGRQNDNGDVPQADIALLAEDILPKHCIFHRSATGGPTMLCPFPDAAVTKNGNMLKEKGELCPGDVIGLGQSYLFLFKDPLMHKELNSTCTAPEPKLSTLPWLFGNTTSAHKTSQTRDAIFCNTCTVTKKCLKRAPPFLKSPEGHCLSLNYQADNEHSVIQQIIALGSSDVQEGPSLSIAFLLCLCTQYSASYLRTSDLRRLLLLIASEIQSAVWEQTKKLAAFQKQVNKDAISRLLPLVVWMSNSLEVLQFIQYQLPVILEWRTCEENEERREGEFWENLDLLELQLSSVHSTTEETVAALEEVVMLTFQQCVYYVTKVLYPILPAFLDCNPFKEGHSLTGKGAPVLGSSGLTVPDQVQQVVDVLSETQRLLSNCQLHPEISTQLIAFLFYFINASLFNLLMERGSEPGFYQRSTAIRIRTNFDLLLNWSRTTGLGKLALEHARTLSSAINLLTTPRKNLLQTSWASLRSEFPALNAAQLNHLLSLYSPTCPTRHTWTPCARDQTEAHRTDDILQSFDTHHPLVLPDGGYQFMVGRAVTDSGLVEHLNKLKDFIFNLPNLQSHGVTVASRHQGITMETKSRQEIMATTPVKTVFSQPTVQTLPPSSSSPPSPASPSLHSSVPYLDEFNSCGALLLSRKLRNLQLQTRETETTELKRSALDPSCLLTPPNTPLTLDPVHWVKEDQHQDAHSWSSDVGAHDEGGLMFECLAALKDDRFNQDYNSMKRIFELIEEEEEEAEETGNHFDDNNDEIFSLELERDKSGLGLALVDTRVKGIFIRAVVPDSPAARCEKLQPGDRILAVNGVSLLGPHCLNGKELMQSSGDRLRLLVARSDWMAKVIQTEC
ncbi:ras-associating and dilute domain-containing protein-like isoform X3 [Hippocampus comes]|uniref:ras-associating and dilute domain-containing protein-like isoform X3 n=1 Tax=Hippocampus comes TaxID=109280 RepID=UPI00094EBE2D|nr:PREDICTED: ras-associating and dilute domain-containing protein-like isoform X3 [Hippocampus comes]